MSSCVIERFEIIQIKKQQRPSQPAACCDRQFSLNSSLQSAAVRELRQWIKSCERLTSSKTVLLAVMSETFAT